MRGTLFVFFFCLFACNSLATDAEDHLVKVGFAEFPGYRPIWTKKLCPSSFDCGRMIVRPAFDPEFSISIHSGKGRTGYEITYVTAEDNLYQLTDGGKFPGRADSVGIRRTDTSIPAKTAQTLRAVWLKVLLSTHGNVAPPKQGLENAPIDAAEIEFSLGLPGKRPLYGQVNIWLDPQRPKIRALLRLGETLLDYCKANESKHEELILNIDAQAQRLLQMN